MTRTYLFARLWIGYSNAFPASRFDEVPDDKLGEALGKLADEWLATSGTPTTRSFQEIAERAGWVVPKSEFDEGPLALPWWMVFHAEPSKEEARDIFAALRERVIFTFGQWTGRAVESRTLTRPKIVLLERQIDQLGSWGAEVNHISVTLKDGEYWPLHALNEVARDLSGVMHRFEWKTEPAEPRSSESSEAQKGAGGTQRPTSVPPAFWAALDPTKQKIVSVLDLVTRKGEARTLQQLVKDTGVKDESTVSKAIGRLREMGAEIPNPNNATGFTLGAVPDQAAMRPKKKGKPAPSPRQPRAKPKPSSS